MFSLDLTIDSSKTSSKNFSNINQNPDNDNVNFSKKMLSNDKEKPLSQDDSLRYLHKKFKRLASAELNCKSFSKQNSNDCLENKLSTNLKNAHGEPNKNFGNTYNNNNNIQLFQYDNRSLLNNTSTKFNNYGNYCSVEGGNYSSESGPSLVNSHTEVSESGQPSHSHSCERIIEDAAKIIWGQSEDAANSIPLFEATKYSHSQNSNCEFPLIVSFGGETENADSHSTPGRYICQYCQLICTKPSVLEKHIRAHTNERPYPCTLCGFAFKTKSNLHKHFK